MGYSYFINSALHSFVLHYWNHDDGHDCMHVLRSVIPYNVSCLHIMFALRLYSVPHIFNGRPNTVESEFGKLWMKRLRFRFRSGRKNFTTRAWTCTMNGQILDVDEDLDDDLQGHLVKKVS